MQINMKKFILPVLVTGAMLFAACDKYDDSEIQGLVKDLEEKVEGLEAKVNANVITIAKLSAALQSGLTIDSVVENADKDGYTIYFSDGTQAVLYHGNAGGKGPDGPDGQPGKPGNPGNPGENGNDGTIPVIGAKDNGGVLCWTVNGEFLLDGNGNPVPVRGGDAIVPQFKLTDGNWYASIDNGATWTLVGSAAEMPFYVEENADTYDFILGDGTVISMPKSSAFKIKADVTEAVLVAGSSFDINYTLSGADETVHVFAEAKGVSAVVDESAKKVTVTVPAAVPATASLIIKAVRNSDGKTVAQYISFEAGVLTLVADAASVGASSSQVEVNVETNVDYEVLIPSEVTWVKLVPATKALRKETITLAVEANTTPSEREALITLKAAGVENKTFVIKQAGASMIADADALLALLASDKVATNEALGITFMLAGDIDMAGKTMVSAPKWYATLDGNGHAIKNWDIKSDQPLVDTNYGTIANIVIDASCTYTFTNSRTDNSLICKNNSGTGYIIGCVCNVSGSGEFAEVPSVRFGTMASYSSGCIWNCTNNGNFSVKAGAVQAGVSSFNYMGSMVGYFSKGTGNNESQTIKGCRNTGNISLEYTTLPKGCCVGGIAGATSTSTKLATAVNKGLITDCENTGNVTFKVDASGTCVPNVGGIAGFLECDIKNCVNRGKVSFIGVQYNGSENGNNRPAAGGVVGTAIWVVENCHNYGEVYVNACICGGSTYVQATGFMNHPSFGGVVGMIGAPKHKRTSIPNYIKDCHNEGPVNVDQSMKSGNSSEAAVGGVAGVCGTNAENVSNKGAVTVKNTLSGIRLGGVIGYADSCALVKNAVNDAPIELDMVITAANGNQSRYLWSGCVIGDSNFGITIEGCRNTANGSFIVKNGYMTASLSYLGGIAGRLNVGGTSIIGCENAGTLSTTTLLKNRWGGIVGMQNGGKVMEDCHNTGNITATGFDGAGFGGLAGHSGAAICKDCSTDCKITNNGTGVAYSGLAVGSQGKTKQVWDNVTIGGELVAPAAGYNGIIIGSQVDPAEGLISLTVGQTTPCVVKASTKFLGATVTAEDLVPSKLCGHVVEGFEDVFTFPGVVLK